MSQFQTDYYTINNFRSDMQSLLDIKNDLNNVNRKSFKMKYNNINNNNNINFISFAKNNDNMKNDIEYNLNENDDEIIKIEIKNLKSENDELKFCLNNIINLLDKKFLKISEISNINKEKINNIKKEILNKNILIKSLNEKIKNLEILIAKSNENKNSTIQLEGNKTQKNNKVKENNELKKELDEKNYENELLIEIKNLKNNLSIHQQKLNELNNEIKEKDNIINQLKTEINENSNIEIEIKQLKIELKERNNNINLLNNEIETNKKNLSIEKSNNKKIEDKINQTNNLIKEENENQKIIEKDYNNKINSLIKKYEQEINLKKNNNIKNILEENNELKNVNKELNLKFKELLFLKKNYEELLYDINKIKEENELLKNEINQTKKNNINNSFNKKINDNDLNITIPNKQLNYNFSNNKMFVNNTTISDSNEYKTTPILNDNIYKKNFPFDKMKKINNDEYKSDYKENNISFNNEKISKRPLLSSLIISDTNRKKRNYEENSIENKNVDNKEKIDNLEKIETDESFNIYKPIKEGLLVFNIAKKLYYIIVPEKYSDFWKEYQVEGSLQYNTLEGLFLINAKNNQLYYYSSKKNIFCDLLIFKDNHSHGCLFVDNLSKNIIAIGGKYSKSVELFSFDSGKIEDLPELSTHRSKMTCCQVNTKIYCLFGISEEKPDKSLIEYLDLDNLNQGWIDINYNNNAFFKILTYMSCVNLNDSELLIIGGKINDNISNEKIIYYNAQSNELYDLDKDLPESDNKTYLFSQNNMFNLFLNGKIISFINIDDYNQVHIIDNELKYDLYLSPKI